MTMDHSDGWMATKKTGSQVSRDKELAKQQRKHKTTKTTWNQAAATKPKQKEKKQNDYYSDEISYYESDNAEEDLGEFIEGDEEEEEGDVFSVHSDNDGSDDDDELEILPPKATAANFSSSESEAESFLPKAKPRQSKASAALSKASLPAKRHYNALLNSKQTKLLFTNIPHVKQQTSKRRSNASDTEVLTSPSPTPAKKKTITKSKYYTDSSGTKTSPMKAKKLHERKYIIKNESHDDIFLDSNKSKKKRIRNSGFDGDSQTSSSAFAKKNPEVVLNDSDTDDAFTANEMIEPVAKIGMKQKTFELDSHNNNVMKSPSTFWMDSPEQVTKKVKRLVKKKKKLNKYTNALASFAAPGTFDSEDDMDEQTAIQMAIERSKSEWGSSNKKPFQKVIDIDKLDEEEEPMFNEMPEEEESSDGEEDECDAYDEEKQTATNVLQTAQQLSARVLQTMSKWMSQDDGAGASQGMIIVDGALSLGNASIGGNTTTESSAVASNRDKESDSSPHEWISQETMQSILPNVKLSNYQLVGVNWLSLLHGMKCNIEDKSTTNVNGVLADEMGLGKTIQTIAFLAWLKYQYTHQIADIDKDDASQSQPMPHLIVVPVSVLSNWMREFETFAPDLNVVKYYGSMAEREEIQEELRQYLKKSSAGNGSRNKKWQKHLEGGSTISLDVILAPVTYFQKEKSDDRKFLNKFQYDYLVVDEAHMLKNSQSTRYKMLDKAKTLHRLLLTGTPVQNSPQELLNMLCFLMPLFGKGGGSTPFDDSESQQNVEERMLQHFVEHEKIDGRDDQQAYQKLKHLFAPFVLRRKKSDVISQLLPPKEHVLENVNLDPSARNIYDQILASHVNKNGDKVTAAIGDHLFTNLRKAAHHPLLLRTRHNSPSQISHMVEHFHKYGAFKGEGSTRARVREELTKFNDFHIHLTAHDLIDENPHRRADLERYILPEDALYSSAKFCRLQTLLPNLIHKDHRILIFSAWTSCLDLLGCLMEHLNLQYLRMDGSTPSAERQELIDHFNSESDIKVFLLSTKACGLGINLTAADTCIIHDLDFNPFNDLQAEDRCHRIGQKKPVTVYKMITNDTVDADIYMMQERKSKMNAAIMESGSSAKSSDKKIRKEMLQSAVERFLGSPKLSLKRASSDGKQSNKENKEVVDVIRGKENMG